MTQFQEKILIVSSIFLLASCSSSEKNSQFQSAVNSNEINRSPAARTAINTECFNNYVQELTEINDALFKVNDSLISTAYEYEKLEHGIPRNTSHGPRGFSKIESAASLYKDKNFMLKEKTRLAYEMFLSCSDN